MVYHRILNISVVPCAIQGFRILLVIHSLKEFASANTNLPVSQSPVPPALLTTSLFSVPMSLFVRGSFVSYFRFHR